MSVTAPKHLSLSATNLLFNSLSWSRLRLDLCPRPASKSGRILWMWRLAVKHEITIYKDSLFVEEKPGFSYFLNLL